MTPDDLRLGQALGSGGEDIILIQHVQDGGFQQSRIGCDVQQRAGQHGKNGIFPSAKPQLLTRGPADDREPFQGAGKVFLENQAQYQLRHAHQQHRKHDDRPVYPRVSLHRRDHAQK